MPISVGSVASAVKEVQQVDAKAPIWLIQFMEKLRDAQRKWIKEKDSAASSESSKYAKGSEEKATQEYITKARVTRDRCYELLKYYMY